MCNAYVRDKFREVWAIFNYIDRSNAPFPIIIIITIQNETHTYIIKMIKFDAHIHHRAIFGRKLTADLSICTLDMDIWPANQSPQMEEFIIF